VIWAHALPWLDLTADRVIWGNVQGLNIAPASMSWGNLERLNDDLTGR
jgi:hypothetical protein